MKVREREDRDKGVRYRQGERVRRESHMTVLVLGRSGYLVQLTRLSGLGNCRLRRKVRPIPETHHLFIVLQVAFAKTHKTGSSTLQNIFFRFGDKNNLSFAMPETSWMFSYKQPFNVSLVMDQPGDKVYDLFIFHRLEWQDYS